MPDDIKTVPGPEVGRDGRTSLRFLAALKDVTAVRSYISVADQVVISGSNFVLNVFLARFLPMEDYGLFVVAYTLLLLVTAVQSAVFGYPVLVIGVKKDKAEVAGYLTSSFVLQFVYAGVMSAAAFAAIAVLSSRYGAFGTPGITVFVLFGFCFLGLQFFRRVLYLVDRVGMVLVADVVFTVLMFSGLVAFQYSGGLTLEVSLWVLAAASLAAYGAGFYFSMHSLSLRNISLGKAALENWRFGKWLIGQGMCAWGSGQIYYILSAMLLDMRAPALLKVCATLLAPLHVIFQGLDNILTISISRKLKESAYAARSFMLKAGALVAGLSAVYVVVILLFAKYILNVLFGGSYSGLSGIVWIFAVAYLFRSISSVPALGLISMHATKDVFLVQLATMATTLLSMYPLLKYWGVTGAAIGMVLIPYFMVAVLTIWRIKAAFDSYDG